MYDGEPDPDRIDDRSGFGRALTLLKDQAGLTVRDIAKMVGVPPATAGDYFAGRSLPPLKTAEVLPAILRACGITDPARVHQWRMALMRVRRESREGRESRAEVRTAPYRGLSSFQISDWRGFSAGTRWWASWWRDWRADALLGAALTELLERGLAQTVDRADGAWSARTWQVHPLVSEAVREGEAADALAGIASTAADVVRLACLRREPEPGWAVFQHAAWLAERADVPVAARTLLWWQVIQRYRGFGQFAAAWEAAGKLVALTGEAADELLLAAEVGVSAGEYADAVALCRRLISPTGPTPNNRTDHRARSLAAKALDGLGRYADADELLAPVHGGAPPDWLRGPDLARAQVDRAVALRLRGRFRPARELLERTVPNFAQESTRDAIDEGLASARVELASTQLLTGRIKAARVTAKTVVDGFGRAGLPDHPLCLDAVGQLAEAEMTVDLTERHAREVEWAQAEQAATSAHADYVRSLGESNPRTLFAAYQRDLAQVRLGRAKTALVRLRATEQQITAVLGERHPLRLRIRYAITQAHGQLGDYPRQHVLLAELLPQQLRELGPYHPDTLASQLDLGIAAGLIGRGAEARQLITEATRRIGGELDWRADLRTRAEVSRALLLLPTPVWQLFGQLARLWGRPKD